MFFNDRKRVVGLAAQRRLPSMWGAKELVELGGLMVYGTSIPDLIRSGAT
jgi:hypothetical protein